MNDLVERFKTIQEQNIKRETRINMYEQELSRLKSEIKLDLNKAEVKNKDELSKKITKLETNILKAIEKAESILGISKEPEGDTQTAGYMKAVRGELESPGKDPSENEEPDDFDDF